MPSRGPRAVDAHERDDGRQTRSTRHERVVEWRLGQCADEHPPSPGVSVACAGQRLPCVVSLAFLAGRHPYPVRLPSARALRVALDLNLSSPINIRITPSLFAQHRNQDPSQSRSLNLIRSRVTASPSRVIEVMGYFRVVRDERAQRLPSRSAARRSGVRVSPKTLSAASGVELASTFVYGSSSEQ